MKHLKKILIVIAMLALLVASFAVVIGAEEPAQGSVAKINELIAKIEASIQTPAADDPIADQAKKVTAAYDYIRNPDLVWDGVAETAEYKEAVAKVDGYCIQVAQSYCNVIEDVEKDQNKSISGVNDAYSFLTKCDPAKSTAGYDEVVAAITQKNEAVTEKLYAYVVIPDKTSTTFYATLDVERSDARSLFKQLAKCPLVSEELYTKYSMIAYDLTTLMLDEYEAFIKVATSSSEDYWKTINDIRTAQAFVADVDISKAPGYSATMDRIAENIAYSETVLEAKRQSLDALAPFEEYDLGYFMNMNFDGNLTAEQYAALTSSEKAAYDAQNKHLPYPNAAGEHKTERVFEELNNELNGYLKFMYGSQSIHHYTYIETKNAGGMEEYGIVFEWDMRVNETNANTIGMMAVDNVRTVNGGSAFASLFDIKAGDANFMKVVSGGYNKAQSVNPDQVSVTVSNAVVIDVWTHFTMTYNPETRIGAFYVNYEKVFDIYHLQPEKYTMNFRLGPSTVTNWEGWDLDNIEIYYGTAYRITDKFAKMSADEEFAYYVNYAFDGMGNAEEYLARNNAYNKAKVMVSNYSPNNPSVIKFNSINYNEDIKYPAMNQNLGILTEKVEKLGTLAVNTENIKKINEAIADINSFVNKNASLIDKADTSDNGYQAQMAVVYTTEANVKKLESIQQFVAAVEKFERATTLSSRTRHAETAAEIYRLAEYEIAANREFVADDPIVYAFEQYLNGQKNEDGTYLEPTDKEGNPTPGYIAKYLTVPELDEEGNPVVDDETGEVVLVRVLNPDYETIFEYYDSFPSLLAARERFENSKNIINAITRISRMDGFELTENYFAENYDELKSYTLLIRSYISSGKYDAEYPGVDEALEVFYVMDVYFFEMLQLEHIATLEQMLAKYDEVSTYVEKMAVVNSVKAYFDTEDTALNNTTITKAVRLKVEDEAEALTKLQSRNEVYALQLEGLSDSYLDVLAQQTEYFINIINHMDSVIVFSEIEKLFNEATTYYYGINLNVEGALEAAEKYADYRAYIASVKENNAAFSMYIKDLSIIVNDDEIVGAERRNEIFAALKNASVYVDSVDSSDKTISSYITFYYTQLAAYESNISAIESAIYEAVQFSNALRTNTLPATVLSVIGKLINN